MGPSWGQGCNKPPGAGASSRSPSLRASPILSEDQECPSSQQPDGGNVFADSGTADTEISQRAQKELPVGSKKIELACNLSLTSSWPVFSLQFFSSQFLVAHVKGRQMEQKDKTHRMGGRGKHHSHPNISWSGSHSLLRSLQTWDQLKQGTTSPAHSLHLFIFPPTTLGVCKKDSYLGSPHVKVHPNHSPSFPISPIRKRRQKKEDSVSEPIKVR